ncbi:MAG: hypothetical protein ACI8Q1_002395 [Parvicella sp.]|jgi:hypothetical protein
MKRSILIWICLCFSIPTIAQYSENIRSARPGQAVGPFTTGKELFQVQTGVNYTNYTNNETARDGNIVEYLASLRYGVLENMEIRSAFKVRRDKINTRPEPSRKFGGLSFWNVGLRYNIVSGTGFKPSFGVQGDIKLTWVDPQYRSSKISPRIMLIHGQRLTEKIGVTTNFSMTLNGESDKALLGYIVKFSFPIAKKWTSFIENYGQGTSVAFLSRWDTGLAYLVNKDLQLDLFSGFGINNGQKEWFIDTGISWRVGR